MRCACLSFCVFGEKVHLFPGNNSKKWLTQNKAAVAALFSMDQKRSHSKKNVLSSQNSRARIFQQRFLLSLRFTQLEIVLMLIPAHQHIPPDSLLAAVVANKASHIQTNPLELHRSETLSMMRQPLPPEDDVLSLWCFTGRRICKWPSLPELYNCQSV